MVKKHSCPVNVVCSDKRVLSGALALALILGPVTCALPVAASQEQSNPTESSIASDSPASAAGAGGTSGGNVELHPAALIGKSLGAYGGEDVVQKLLRGMTIVGKQFDQVSLDSDALAGLDAVENLPRLGLGDRTRLLDADGVAGLELVALVVRVVLLRAADDLPVQRVLHLALDQHGHGLVGLVGNHGPDEDALGHRVPP